jgi:hypothetical protein
VFHPHEFFVPAELDVGEDYDVVGLGMLGVVVVA